MNPALSQEFHLFCEQEQLQKHATLDKNQYTVYTAPLRKEIRSKKKRKEKKKNGTSFGFVLLKVIHSVPYRPAYLEETILFGAEAQNLILLSRATA